MTITLSWFETFQAATVGAMRQIEARKLGRADEHGYSGEGWNLHIEGAAAEMALAKYLNDYWEGVARDPHSLAGDVGAVQVRSTARVNGSLILHPDDPDEARFYLLTGFVPTFTVRGWITGAEGKREDYWRTDTGRPAYFVPQSALHSEGQLSFA